MRSSMSNSVMVDGLPSSAPAMVASKVLSASYRLKLKPPKVATLSPASSLPLVPAEIWLTPSGTGICSDIWLIRSLEKEPWSGWVESHSDTWGFWATVVCWTMSSQPRSPQPSSSPG